MFHVRVILRDVEGLSLFNFGISQVRLTYQWLVELHHYTNVALCHVFLAYRSYVQCVSLVVIRAM